MTRFAALPVFGALLLFSSCDCYRMATGTVVNKSTGDPVELALITPIKKEYFQIYTDSAGTFKVTDISGGLFRCPAMKLRIEKEGFEPQNIRLRGKPKEIKLVKVKF